MSKITCETAHRFNPTPQSGLTTTQVNERIKEGLINKTKHAVGKSYTEIIFNNVFSFFNVLLFVIAGLLIYAGEFNSLFFLFVLIPNIIIGLYEDIKARVLLSRLRLLTQPKARVIRDGCMMVIETKDIVLEDVMLLKGDCQICADGEIVEGSVLVNESLLTGESLNVTKNVGDQIFSGTFVVSGNAKAIARKIGRENYVETLQKSANKFKRSPSQILKSLRRMFKVIGGIVIITAAAIICIYASQQRFTSELAFKEFIGPFAGSLVAMIPSGLYLLTSLALATAVISLSKKKAQVQDFYSVEMLARTNCLCVDKTGTITDGSMSVKKVLPLATGMSIVEIEQIISNVLHATNDDNLTAKSLKNYFKYELTQNVEISLPFNSDNKYSGASFKGGMTYIMGAIDCLPIGNKESILKRAQEFTFYGYRVLLVAQTKNKIKDNKIEGPLVPLAFIILQDNVRPDAVETFKMFKDNGVEIKVISGDDPQTVSEIARQAGIDGYDHFISLAHMSNEEVAKVATEYNVFGRVTPEQKEIIVKTLKKAGKTVAMTGDGVNDILALKRADCSIAMASGSDAARNVSHIVLMDSNFARLPSIVEEGRRVVNNLQRTASLFLTKTIFAVVFTLYFLIASIAMNDKNISYPFITNNMYLWEIFSIGITAFLLALERNNERIHGSFLGNVFKKAIPAGLTIVIGTFIAFILMYMQKSGAVFTNVFPDVNEYGEYITRSETATAMATLIFTSLSLVTLFRVCVPFSKYRKFVFLGNVLLVGGALLVAAAYTYHIGWEQLGSTPVAELKELNIFKINFLALAPVNYFETLIIIVGCSSLYLIGTLIYDVLRGKNYKEGAKKKDDKNQSGSIESTQGK